MSASAHPPPQAIYVHDHAPEPYVLGRRTFDEQQMSPGDGNCASNSITSLSHYPPTTILPLSSSSQASSMAKFPSSDSFQVFPVAPKSTSGYQTTSTTAMLNGDGWTDAHHYPHQIMNFPLPRIQPESKILTLVEPRASTQRMSKRSYDLNQSVQAADKKAQAEKHRKSEQERRKGATDEMSNLEWHVPKVWLDKIESRSTKVRRSGNGTVTVSRPAKIPTLRLGIDYIEALEDELTAQCKAEQRLRAILAALETPSSMYITPPESPKLRKCSKSGNPLEADKIEAALPTKRTWHQIYDADAEWTDWEEDWQDRRPKRHEGEPWESRVLLRLEAIHRRMRGGRDMSTPAADGLSTPSSPGMVVDALKHFEMRSTASGPSEPLL